MRREASVTVALPFEGHIAPGALIALLRLLFTTQRRGMLSSVTFSEGGVIDRARNELVSHALETDPEMSHLLWVDPGLVVPADAVQALVACGRAVAGAATPQPERPDEVHAYELEPFRWLRGPQPAPRRVGGLGLGCTLVEASVFRRLRARHGDEAWFRCFYGRSVR